MRSEVLYRDLPGGPLPVKFADEVSLWCLCSKCGMYANDMFQDSASHVFCSVCIFECSDRKKIHCKHEKKDVPVDDMIQAVDVRQVMRDQIVFCPNNNGDNGCTTYCALKDLQVHYLECAGTEINCLCCGGVVKGLDWERHINTCPQQILQCRYCLVAIPRCRLQAHEELCYDNPGASQQSRSTTPPSDPSNLCSQPSQRKERKANFDSTAHNGAPVTEMQVHSGGSIMQCIYCKRNVKRKNIERHQEVCGQKKRPAVSDVGKSPGNIEITPDLRNTPTVGQYDPLGQAASFQNSSPLRVQPRGHSRNIPVVAPSDFPPDETTLQNSFASCGSHLIARDSKSASIFGSNDPIQEATALRNTFTLCSQQSTATDSRSPSTLGSNDPVREASRNSFTSSSQQSQDNSWVIVNGRAACPYTESCETPPGCPEMAEEALRSSIVNCGMDAVSAKVASAITTAVKFPTALLSAAGRLLSGNYGDGADLAVADHESSPEKYEEASVHQETVAHSSQKSLKPLLNGAGRILGGNYGEGADLGGADHESLLQKYEAGSVRQEMGEQTSQKVPSNHFGYNPRTTGKAPVSDLDPGVTSCSIATYQHADSGPPWPAHTTYECISLWVAQFDAWLNCNGITQEELQFPVLLNRIPKVFSDALFPLQYEAKPYSAAKATVLLNFQRKDQR